MFFVLLLFLATQSRADDSFVILGPTPLNFEGKQSTNLFPAGTKARLVKIKSDRVVFEIKGRRYETTTAKASYYFEGGNWGKKYLFGEALKLLQYSEDLQAHPSCFEIPRRTTCPWDMDGGKWDDELMRRAVLGCKIEKVDIVKREIKGEFKENCRNERGNPDVEGGAWKSCAPAPICDSAQEELKRAQTALRKKDETNKCLSKPRVKPDLLPEAACMLPFRKPISKLVIHQTDASFDKGPNDVFNWHRDRGYDDMGYHYIIGKDANGEWKVFEGRSRKVEGAHGGPGANSDSLAIAIAGCYRTGEVDPTNPCTADAKRPPPEAVRLLTNLVGKLKKEEVGADGKSTITQVLGHGQHRYANTKCHSNCPSPSCQILVNRLTERFFGGKK